MDDKFHERYDALHLAIEYHKISVITEEAQSVLETAKEFYKFLNGDDNV